MTHLKKIQIPKKIHIWLKYTILKKSHRVKKYTSPIKKYGDLKKYDI